MSNNDWISVEDEMPKEVGIYIGYFPDLAESGRYVDTCYFTGTSLYEASGLSTSHCFKPTHWMKFPEKPHNSPKQPTTK